MTEPAKLHSTYSTYVPNTIVASQQDDSLGEFLFGRRVSALIGQLSAWYSVVEGGAVDTTHAPTPAGLDTADPNTKWALGALAVHTP
jgi:hypothetical protein